MDDIPADDIANLLAEHLHEPSSSWSVGEFGLLAEFHHTRAQVSASPALTVVAEGGALRVASIEELRICGARILAYETPSPNPRLWNHGVAFCLPDSEAHMEGRQQITELGADSEAVFEAARSEILFDLGLGRHSVNFCVRTADPALIALLRGAIGERFFDRPDLMTAVAAAGPARVVVSRIARIEVTNPIPPAGGVSPTGPHTHLLPDLMKSGRTHNASIPVPAGFLPCLTLYPAHPARDSEGHERPFDARQHAAFQQLLARHGNPDYLVGKREAAAAVSVEAGERNRPHSLGRLIAVRQHALVSDKTVR